MSSEIDIGRYSSCKLLQHLGPPGSTDALNIFFRVRVRVRVRSGMGAQSWGWHGDAGSGLPPQYNERNPGVGIRSRHMRRGCMQAWVSLLAWERVG